MSDERYDVVLVGAGFASAFFLHEALRHLAPGARVLVLERGPRVSHAEQIAARKSRRRSFPDPNGLFTNRTSIHKEWTFTAGFGGGSNCWWGCVPRMLPEDFELRSRYGVGADWPIGYDDLEEYYGRVEEIMGVSGDSNDTPFERGRPYP